RRPLIGCDRGVALNQLHAPDAYAELFGNELSLRRKHALSELTFAGVRSHQAVRAYRDPRIELTVRRSSGRLGLQSIWRHTQLAGESSGTEAHTQRHGTITT